MSAIIGSLRGLLSLESAAFESGAKRGIASMGNVERRMVRLGNTVERQGRRLALGLTVPMVGAATLMVKSSLKIVDAQAKMAQSLGTSVQSMQVMQRAADLSGVSIGEVEQATIQLTKRLSQAAAGGGPAAKALDKLHLSAADLQRLPLDERLAKIQDAIARFVPEAERAAVASDLFGSRAGLIFTRIDSSALRLATDDVTRFGVAISEVDADQIERTNDAISRMGIVGRGVANQLTVALAPTLEHLSDKAADAAEWFNNLSDDSKQFIAVGSGVVAVVGPLAIGLGLVLKLAAPLGVALVGVVSTPALAPVKFLAAAKASVALELALGATSTKAALGSLAIKGMTRGLVLLRVAALATGLGALIGVAAGIYQGFAQSQQAAEDYAIAIEDAAAAHDLLSIATDQFYRNMTAKNAEAMRRAAEAARDATRQALAAARAELEAASFTTNFFGLSLGETDRMAKARADIEALSGALATAEARLDAAAVAADQTAKNAGEAADNIDAAAQATNPLMQGLGGAAGQAAALRGYLSGLPGALAGAQANISGLKAGMAVLSAGGGEAAANVAKYRAELVAALPPLEGLQDGQREHVEEGINQQVRLYEENQRLSAEYRNQITAINKVSAAGGSASKSTLAALQKEIRDRRALVGLTDEQRRKLEAVRAVQQKLGKEGAGIGKAQIEALADQVIELDRTEEAMERVKDQQERWAEQITRTAFEGGSLTDTIKGMLRDIAYQFAHSKIVLPVVASVSGILGLGGQTSGAAVSALAGGGGGGGLGGGLLSGVGNIASLVGGGGGVLSGIGSGLGGVLSGGGLGSSFANLGGLVSGATGGWGAVGAAIPAVGIILAVVALIAKGLSREYAGTGIRGSFDAEGFNGSQFDFYKGGWLRSNRTYYSSLEYEFEKALDGAMSGLTTGIKDMAGTLGLGLDALKGFSGESFTIWINGKSQEEIQAALQEQIEITGNSMAELVLGTDEFSRVGETALETLGRLSTSLLAVNDVADLLGHQKLDLSLTGGDHASSLADLFGGTGAMNTAANTYFAGFYSETEQTDTILRRLGDTFADLGVAMPDSRAAYRDLVEGLDLTTTYGQKLYANLLQLSGAMDQVLPQIDGLSLSMTDMLDDVSAEITLQIETARGLAQDARAAASLWAKTADSLRDYIADLSTSDQGAASSDQAMAAQRIRFEEAYAAAQGGDQEAAASLSALARGYLQSAQGAATSSQDYRRIAAMVQSQLSHIAGISDQESSEGEKLAALYERQIEVLTSLDELLKRDGFSDEVLEGLSTGMKELMQEWESTAFENLTDLVQPLENLQDMLGELRDAVDADRVQREAQQEISRLQSVGTAVAEARQSQSEGTLETFQRLRHQFEISLIGQGQSVGLDENGLLTSSFDYYSGTEAGLAAFKQALQAELGSQSYSQIMGNMNASIAAKNLQLEQLRNQVRGFGGIPQFAAGGVHAGGWRVVGERGWELENTGSSRVISNSDSKAMLDNRQVVSSIQDLARQAGVQGQKVELLMRTITRVIEGWDDVGLPKEVV